MISGRARGTLGTLAVLSAVSVCLAALRPAGAQSIQVQSIKGTGEYSNSESLIIDGQMPADGADWNGPQCVYWEGAQARFVLTLDGVYQITGLMLQADNNDDYVIEASMDGTTFKPLLAVKGDWGEVFTGLQTLSTVKDDPHFLADMALKPAQAKHLRLSARNGDEAYSISELLVYGSKVVSGPVTPPVEGGGSVPPVVPSARLKAKSIKGFGEFTHAANLLIDQKMPPQGTYFDDKACVFWSDPKAYFVIDLGEAFWITGLTIQADNNDDYVIQVSLDGKTFKPLLAVNSLWGEIETGMDTFSTMAKDPQYLKEMAIKPGQARYVKLIAKNGDEAYSVSELLLYGSKTPPAQPPTGTAEASADGVPTLEDVFNRIDTNKDGKISKEEYDAIWKDKTDVDKKFVFFDRDSSGTIEKAEYLGLANKMKQDNGGQSTSDASGPAPLDPAKVRQAITAIPNWARIRELVSARKTDEANRIAKDAGFEGWPALERYFVVLETVQAGLETNPDAVKESFARLFGPETVKIVSEPANMEKIRANRQR